ncbi:MAG: hypothetical protein IIC27_03535, partial [Chloroflexi bacterium]|nr:hypothetical protein [Chloroflexota bacterium]
GEGAAKTSAILDFIRGPQFFDSFDALLERTMTHNPTRSESSLRRGVLHNAKPLPDGRWAWRYDRGVAQASGSSTADGTAAHAVTREEVAIDFSHLWSDFQKIRAPIELYRGALDFVATNVPDGANRLAEWERSQKEWGFHVERDLLSWLSGESISIQLPPSGGQGVSGVVMIRVNDPRLAAQKVNAALDYLAKRLPQL